MAKQSAHLAASKLPISFLPKSAAPPHVPKYEASLAVINLRITSPALLPLREGDGDAEKPVMPSLTRETSIALRTSAKRCEPSLEAEPSTPRPTFTPAARYSLTGAIPEASLMLEVGQCATPPLCLAKT